MTKINAGKRLMARNNEDIKKIIKEVFNTSRVTLTPKGLGVSGTFAVPEVIHTKQLHAVEDSGMIINSIEFSDGEFIVDFASA